MSFCLILDSKSTQSKCQPSVLYPTSFSLLLDLSTYLDYRLTLRTSEPTSTSCSISSAIDWTVSSGSLFISFSSSSILCIYEAWSGIVMNSWYCFTIYYFIFPLLSVVLSLSIVLVLPFINNYSIIVISTSH